MPTTPPISIPIRIVDRITTGTKKAQQGIRAFGRAHGRTMQSMAAANKKASGTFSKLLKTFGAIQGIRLAGRAIRGIVDLNREYEKTLDSVVAKFGGMAQVGEATFAKLQDTAKQVGSTTEFTASEAAQGLEFLAMAGFSAEQSMQALPQVVDLATASNVDLARATDIASDTLGAFKLETDDLARVNDVMAKTVTTANTNMEGLFESFVKAGPQATSLGQSIETVSAATGVLANAGIKGSDAGTSLRNMMLRLSAPTGAAKDSINALGLQVFDQEGNMRDLVNIIGDLERSTGKLTEKQRTQHLSNIFGARTITGVNVLLQEGADSLREYRSTLEGSTGAAADMAAEMRDNLDGSIKTLQSKIQGFMLGGGSAFTQQLKTIIDGISGWIDANNKLIEQKLADILKGIGNTAQSVGKIIGWLAKKRRLACPYHARPRFCHSSYTKPSPFLQRQKTWLLNIAMGANPIGLVVIAIGALIAGIILLVKHWDKIKEAIITTGQAIKAFFYTVLDGIVTYFANIIKNILKIAGEG